MRGAEGGIVSGPALAGGRKSFIKFPTLSTHLFEVKRSNASRKYAVIRRCSIHPERSSRPRGNKGVARSPLECRKQEKSFHPSPVKNPQSKFHPNGALNRLFYLPIISFDSDPLNRSNIESANIEILTVQPHPPHDSGKTLRHAHLCLVVSVTNRHPRKIRIQRMMGVACVLNCLNQHRSSFRRAPFGDPTVDNAVAAVPGGRTKAKIAHHLAALLEPRRVRDHTNKRGRHNRTDSRNRLQPRGYIGEAGRDFLFYPLIEAIDF